MEKEALNTPNAASQVPVDVPAANPPQQLLQEITNPSGRGTGDGLFSQLSSNPIFTGVSCCGRNNLFTVTTLNDIRASVSLPWALD